MKKLVLKGWVEYLLITLSCIALLMLGGEAADNTVFIASKLIGLLVIGANYVILKRFGRIVNE